MSTHCCMGKYQFIMNSKKELFFLDISTFVSPKGDTPSDLGGNVEVPTTSLRPLLNNVVSVASGFEHALVLTQDGCLHAWGMNAHIKITDVIYLYRLFHHLNPLVFTEKYFENFALDNRCTTKTYEGYLPIFQKLPIFEHLKVVEIACGYQHNCILTQSGEIYSWGCIHGWGELNSKDIIKIDLPSSCAKVISISTGAGHTLALDEMGNVFMWGRNSSGQLGTKGADIIKKPVPLILPSQSSDTEEKDNPTKVLAVCCAWFTSFVLTNKGTIWGWGFNNYGEVGQGDIKERPSPTPITFNDSFNDSNVKQNGKLTLVPQEPKKQSKSPLLNSQSNRSEKIVAMAAGAYPLLALTDQGRVYRWGREYMISFESSSPHLVAVNVESIMCGYCHVLLVGKDDKVYFSGDVDSRWNRSSVTVQNFSKVKWLKRLGKGWGWGNEKTSRRNHLKILYNINWKYTRFIFLGRLEEGCLLSTLPIEILMLILGYICIE